MMLCNDSQDLLLDLVYDELDEVRAAAVRRHLEGCALCRATLAQLRATRRALAQLPAVDPPPVSDALRAALEEATARNMSATAASTPREDPSTTTGPVDAEHLAPVLRLDAAPHKRLGVHDFVRRAGALAMHRQVAMAAVFLVMLGFGLRYLPSHRAAPLTTLDAPAPEVIPATQLPSDAPASAERAASLEGPLDRRHSPVVQPPPSRPIVAVAPSHTRGAAQPAVEPAATARTRAAPTAADPLIARGLSPSNDAAVDPTTSLARVARSQETDAPALPSAAPSPPAAPAWLALQREAEQHRGEGRSAEAVQALRQALALNPPPEARRDIARTLYADLLRAGQVREAAEVRAQHLTSAADGTGLAGNLPGTFQGSPAGSGAPPSTYRPGTPRPSRRAVNTQNDFSNQLAY